MKNTYNLNRTMKAKIYSNQHVHQLCSLQSQLHVISFQDYLTSLEYTL